MIILAAGQGTRLKPLTSDRPKAMVEIAGRSILDWQVAVAASCGITDIIVVTGFAHDAVNVPGITIVHNSDFASTNMVQSLWCAEHMFGDSIVISYGDILYKPSVLQSLLESKHDAAVVVDTGFLDYWQQRFENPIEDLETLRMDESVRLLNIGQKPRDLSDIQAQYAGLMRFSGPGIDDLRRAYECARQQANSGQNPFNCPRGFADLYMTDLLQGMIGMGMELHAVPVNRGWVEIDRPRDLEIARDLVKVVDGLPVI